MKKNALLLLVPAFCLPSLQAEIIATSTFSNAADTEGWSAVTNTTITSGQADAAFITTPVLRAATVAGAPAGNNTRASLSFPAVTLDETDEYVEVKFQLRVASSYASSADRRFQACLWDSTVSDGYLAYFRAAGTGLTSQFVKQANVPATGLMNGGGTTIPATGDTTQPLGSSQTVVHDITYRLLKTETGVEMRFTGTDDTAVLRTITGSDATAPFQVFDRLDLSFWGNTVNFHIDNVEVSTGIYVPPPPDGVWAGEGADSNWSTAENWTGAAVPTAGAGLVFGPAVSELGVNDLPAGTAFNNLTFADGAVFYDLTGNPITLTGKITNGAPLGQALALPIILGGNLALEATAGDLYLDGVISGDHGLVKGGTKLALLSAENTFSGPVLVNQGRVEWEGDHSGADGGFSINNTVASSAGVLADATVSVASGKEITVGTTSSGTAPAVLDVNGTLTNAGELMSLRGSTINVLGTFTQTGPARLEGVGGYGAKMNVFFGGNFVFAGSESFKLNTAPGNAATAVIQVDGGTLTTNQGFTNATAASTAVNSGILLTGGGTLKFSADVADLLTSASAGTTAFRMGAGGGIVDTNGFSATLNLPASGEGSLTKTGAGTFTTTGANAYTGDTIVAAGTLSLGAAGLADASAVIVEEGAMLDLGFGGSDRVGTLTLGEDTLPPGTYSAATHPAFLSGGGSILVASPDPYTDWIDSFTALTEPADKEKSADPDGDGLDNLTEFALAGDPADGRSTGKVAMTLADGHLTLTLPVLEDAAFTGSGPMTATVQGYIYRIEGGSDLTGFDAGIEEITPLTADMPPAGDGWSYRSFRLGTPVSGAAKGFLRADVDEAQ